MPLETTWIIVAAVIAALVGAAVGFVIGRRTASDQRRIETLESEIKAQREQLSEFNAGITAHFEDSAKLFGQLAEDYRAFFRHFSDSAERLGLSEGRAQEILGRVEVQLVERKDDADAVSTDTTDRTASTSPAETEPTPQAETPKPAAKTA